MKTTELKRVQEDNTWVRITFLSPYSKDSMIMKTAYYELNMKKLEKRLPKYYWVDYDYQLTLGEFILMDEEHIRIENHIKALGHSLDFARRHDDQDGIAMYLSRIEEYSNQLLERELQLQEEYKKKGGLNG